MRYLLLLLFLLPLILFGQNIKEINDYPWETIGISNKLTGQPKLKKPQSIMKKFTIFTSKVLSTHLATTF